MVPEKDDVRRAVIVHAPVAPRLLVADGAGTASCEAARIPGFYRAETSAPFLPATEAPRAPKRAAAA